MENGDENDLRTHTRTKQFKLSSEFPVGKTLKISPN